MALDWLPGVGGPHNQPPHLPKTREPLTISVTPPRGAQVVGSRVNSQT